MQLRLECPICESQFEIENENATATSTCPECDREFETKMAIVSEDTKSRREKLILPEEVIANLQTPNADRQVPRSENTQAESELPIEQENPDSLVETASSDLIKKPKRTFTQKPGRLVPFAVMLILAMIAVGLLIYMPYVLKGTDVVTTPQPTMDGSLSDSKTGSPGANGDVTAAKQTTRTSVAASDLDGSGNISGVGLGAGTAPKLDPPKIKRKPRPAPAGKRDFFTQTQFDSIWRENQARIVRLEITNSLGKHWALGTIIDSRGWIVTSFRAVAGASSIKVIQTTRSFEQFAASEPLRDLCKGVILSDPIHDLAVLSINRRFVIEISDLKVADDDQVLGTDQLVQFGILEEDMPLTIRETKVVGRAKFTQLGAGEQEYFDKIHLNADDLRWIQHMNTDGAVPGAPLFSIDGELIGINTQNPAGNTSYAVHAEHLDRLIAKIAFDTKTNGGKNPLSLDVLSEDLERVGLEDRDRKLVVDESSPIRETSVSFNRAARTCANFSWIPKNKQEYIAIQEFARQLIELNTYAVSLAVDDQSPSYHQELQDREKLQSQINEWQDEMLKALSSSPPRTQNSMIKFNESAIDVIQSTNPVSDDNSYQVAYVKVSLTAMDSPKSADGVDTITLEILGTDKFLNVPFDNRFPSMLPETNWLTIFEISENAHLQFKRPKSNEIQEAKRAEMLMIQGPLK